MLFRSKSAGRHGFLRLASKIVDFVLFRGSQVLAWLGGAIVFLLTGITFVTVVGRHSTFAGPWLTGGYELSELLMALLAISAWAYCWYKDGHIRIQLIRDHFGTRGKAIIDVISCLFGLVFIFFASWAMIAVSKMSLNWNVGTPLVDVPLAPFQITFTVFLIHFALVLLGSLFVSIAKACGHDLKKTGPDDG